MNTLILITYLVGILDKLNKLLDNAQGISIIASVCVAAYVFFVVIIGEAKLSTEEDVTIRKMLKWTLGVLIVSAILQSLLPSEKTAWIMVGEYAAGEVLANPTLQHTATDVMALIDAKVQQETASIKKEVAQPVKK